VACSDCDSERGS